jgi:hypothetical protein
MKSLIFTIALVLCFGTGSFAQGQGHFGGPPSGGPSSDHTPHNVGAARDSHSNTGNTSAGDHGPRTAATQIGDHPALASKLQAMLPPGTNIQTAAAGFRNLGQFVAAVHVSKNLNIPFDQLKSKMIDGKMSLGDAVHALKPQLSTDSAKAEAKKAETEAKEDTKS